LQTEIESTLQGSQLLVVIVLAVYTSQSLFAMSQAQMALTELHKKHGVNSPFRFVAVELSESRELASQLRNVAGSNAKLSLPPPPCCLMYHRGAEVYREKLAGSCERLRYPSLARPRVLLVEPTPSNQLVSENALRRCGLSWDLALSASHALQMARQEYGAVLASSELGASLKTVFDAHRSALPFMVHSPDRPVPDAAVEHVFHRPLRKTAVDSVFGRFTTLSTTFEHAGTSKHDFVAEVERAYDAALRRG
jgi:hypothetical protein